MIGTLIWKDGHGKGTNGQPETSNHENVEIDPLAGPRGPLPMQFTYASGDQPLAGYTIKRGVGRGGFGEVYYAVSDGGKDVALKLVQRHLEVELRGVAQCLNLKHPNLVSLLDVKQSESGENWIIMEYMAGERLSDLVSKNPQGLPVPQAAGIVRGISQAVAHLHSRGIVHRDLKPSNVFVDDGVIKLGDYGLSKFISASRHSTQTDSVGTVHYVSPEVAHGHYGKEIDVYALGVIFYELLTGHVPFDGESVGEILMKHLTALPDLSVVPASCRTILSKALEKDRTRRYSSVGEMLAALETVAPSTEGAIPWAAPVGDIRTATPVTFATKVDHWRDAMIRGADQFFGGVTHLDTATPARWLARFIVTLALGIGTGMVVSGLGFSSGFRHHLWNEAIVGIGVGSGFLVSGILLSRWFQLALPRMGMLMGAIAAFITSAVIAIGSGFSLGGITMLVARRDEPAAFLGFGMAFLVFSFCLMAAVRHLRKHGQRSPRTRLSPWFVALCLLGSLIISIGTGVALTGVTFGLVRDDDVAIPLGFMGGSVVATVLLRRFIARRSQSMGTGSLIVTGLLQAIAAGMAVAFVAGMFGLFLAGDMGHRRVDLAISIGIGGGLLAAGLISYAVIRRVGLPHGVVLVLLKLASALLMSAGVGLVSAMGVAILNDGRVHDETALVAIGVGLVTFGASVIRLLGNSVPVADPVR